MIQRIVLPNKMAAHFSPKLNAVVLFDTTGPAEDLPVPLTVLTVESVVALADFVQGCLTKATSAERTEPAEMPSQVLGFQPYHGPPVSIGAVVFRDRHGEPLNLIGEPRVAALQAFYRQDRVMTVVPCADRYARQTPGGELLRWRDVNWATADNRVTGK